MERNLSFRQKLNNSFENVGKFSFMTFDVFKLILLGKIHFRNTIQQMAFIGTDSLPIVLLTGLAIGMVFSLQVSGIFLDYGASGMIGGAVGISIVRELAPLFTGVVIAGRVGAAITAELGSMKVTEQIDALTSMAVNPIRYLVIPRVLACLFLVPLLSIMSVIIGILGGMLIAVFVKGVIMMQFLTSVQDFLGVGDLIKCMIKSSIFGLVVSLVSCFKGINAGEGAQGVGIATTSAVVTSLVSIFILNYLLSLLLFV